MLPTADAPEPGQARSARRLEPMRIPERDNPFAWRAKAKEGRAGAIRLLEALSDEEVARYMEMASDQVRNEERLIWLQLLCSATALGVVIFDMADGLQNGISIWHVSGLLLAAALAYWPWRVRACRRLWLMHVNAAKAELARRRATT